MAFAGPVLDHGGEKFNVKHPEFGAKGDGVTDDTTAFTDVIQSDRTVVVPPGTFKLSNLNFVGKSNIKIVGTPGKSVLDFSGVTSGDALSFGFSAGAGGSKGIVIEGIAITDTRATSTVDQMLVFEGGAAGGSPSQTSAFVTLRNVDILKYNKDSGIALVIDGLSHVLLDSVFCAFELGCGEALVILNTAAVNTGLITAVNSSFYAKARAMRINATGDLMDAFSFDGSFFGNFANSLAVETIKFEGSQFISSSVFNGCHIENRHNTQDTAILTTGKIAAMAWQGCHLSCGTATDQNLYGFRFTGAEVRSCVFRALEFLRVKNKGAGGRAFFFDDDCILDSNEPVFIGPIWRNILAPHDVEVESTSSDENFKAVHGAGAFDFAGIVSGMIRAYDFAAADATPSVKHGKHFRSKGTTTVTNFDDGYQGQEIVIVRLVGETGTQTFQQGTNIKNKSGSDVVLSAGQSVSYRRENASVWYEI